MKANEFVKKFGLEHTKYLIEDTELSEFAIHSSCAGKYSMDTVSAEDLKRLVESHELVESLSGINTMRIMQKQMVLNSLKGGMNISFDGEFVGTFSYDQLKQAITDVESCQ